MSVLQPVAQALGTMLSPLLLALQDKNTFTVFLQSLGWNVELTDDDMTFIADLLAISADLSSIMESVNAFSDGVSGEDIEAVITAVDGIFASIQTLQSIGEPDIVDLVEPLNSPGFWSALATEIPAYLVVTYLRNFVPVVHALLVLGGVIEEVVTESTPPRTVSHLKWNELGALLSNPPGQLATLYGWGSTIEHRVLLERLAALAHAVGLTAERIAPTPHTVTTFYPSGGVPFDLRQLNLLFYDGVTGDVYIRAGVSLLAVPQSGDTSVNGLYLSNLVQGDTSSADLSPLQIEGDTSGSGAVGLRLLPGVPPAFEGSAAEVNFALKLVGDPDQPYLLIGDANGARLQLSGYEIEVRLDGTVSKPEIILRTVTSGGGLQAIIAPADGDSFVRGLLGETELSVGAEIALEWSSATGFALEGGIGLDITFPLNLNLFLLTILELHLALWVETTGAIQAQADVDASAVLGPFTLTVADIGAKATLTPSEDVTARGTFGGMEIAWAFKPPDGVGAAFDFLGIVYGGGYIEYDPDTSTYSGMVTVQLAALGITATGIITTSADSWSMFVSINVNLGGIPLGFGFTLEQVGGLVGVNRAIDTDAFLAGVRTGLLDSVMFPEDPIANAPRILSDIETAFPTAFGSYVFGAMLQIGWGVPTLITGSIGFIIQVPDVIITLLGQVETILPVEEVPLIEIHFDVVGILDLTTGTLAIDAGLRDSQIVGFVLTGQMAMRASFLNAPSFLLAMGGFHPAFVPPESFPTLARMGIGLSVGDWLSISLEAYLALTSNTVQFGAGLYLTARLVGFSVEGGTEINTLIQFSPFQFRANLSYFITVSAGSVELLGVLLTGHVTGPNPYYVRGTARFKILLLEEEVDIQATIGGTATLDDEEDIRLLDDVVTAMQAPESWRVVDEGSRIGAVLLAENTNGEVAVHPGGSVEVVQRVAPLDVQLEHYGSSEIEGEDLLDIGDVQAGGEHVEWEFAEDWFAPAQFFDLTQDEKLDSPSFEMMKAGLRIGDDVADSGDSSDSVYSYEQIIHDPEFEIQSLNIGKAFKPSSAILADLQAQVVTRSGQPRSLTGASATQRFTLEPARYVVVARDTLTGTGKSMTYAEAAQRTRSGQIVVTTSERQES